MTGRMPEEGVNPVDLPQSVEHVWWWFLALNRKRPQGMAGICQLPESEIGWFFRNRGLAPEPWELDAINRLDAVALESSGEDK
jgi:hypothetical protein